MRFVRHLSRTLLWGLSVGALALLLDELLAFATLGHAIPLAWSHLASYLATGAVLALLIRGVAALGSKKLDGETLCYVSLALLYLLPLCERVLQSAEGWQAEIAVLALGLGYALWSLLLAIWVGPHSRIFACFLSALSAAIALAVNRNLVSRPFEPWALIADLSIVVTVLVLASLVRWRGRAIVMGAIAVWVIATIAVALWSSKAPEPIAVVELEHPNLLMLSIDTLRQDVFRSVLDETREGQAFMEAMGGAAYFSNAAASAPWTVPSVASIMTGLYPQEHGLTLRHGANRSRPLKRLPDPIPTLAVHLRDAGYRTEAIVANPILIPESGIFRGFESYSILAGSTTKLPLLTVFAQWGWLDEELYLNASAVRRKLVQRMPHLIDAREPTFLWLHLMDPHEPLHAHVDLGPDPSSVGLADKDRRYREETRYTLHELTLMIELLDRYGLWSNALVVLVSDHGEMFSSDRHRGPMINGRFVEEGHGHALYSELVRIPLVIRPPGGLSAQRQVEALASHVDIRDTVVDLLGLPLAPFPGRFSLAPWLADSPQIAPSRERILLGGIQNGPPQRGLQTQRYKLIHFPKGHEANQLYDLEEDPLEQSDLAEKNSDLVDQQLEILRKEWDRLAVAPESDGAEVDEQTLERLKALGYLQ